MKQGYYFIRVNDDGTKIVHKHHLGTTWPDMLQYFFDFLRGCSYNISDEVVDKIMEDI